MPNFRVYHGMRGLETIFKVNLRRAYLSHDYDLYIFKQKQIHKNFNSIIFRKNEYSLTIQKFGDFITKM